MRYSLVVSVSEVYMVKHQKCHGVNDVDKFLNNSGLRLDQVQIVYGLTRVGGDYFVFYEDPDEKPSRRKPERPGLKTVKETFDPKVLFVDNNQQAEPAGESREEDIELVPTDKTDGEPDA